MIKLFLDLFFIHNLEYAEVILAIIWEYILANPIQDHEHVSIVEIKIHNIIL